MMTARGPGLVYSTGAGTKLIGLVEGDRALGKWNRTALYGTDVAERSTVRACNLTRPPRGTP
jgi:hypothetical protein